MSDTLEFAKEPPPQAASARRPWTMLIVDDEKEVHAVTMLALDDFTLCGRPLRFLHAYSAREAKEMMVKHSDIAVVLLDVVMETDNAGLEVVEYVRNTLRNRFTRIILRTGQPGQAPELEVIRRYDINGYNHKTELTREKLHTAIFTSLATYRDLMALEANRRGLEKIIESTAQLFEIDSIARFAQGVLEQLIALLFVESDAVMLSTSGIAAAGQPVSEELSIVAATGVYESYVGRGARQALPPELIQRIMTARSMVGLVYGEDYIAGYQSGLQDLVFYVSADAPLSLTDRHLLEMFYGNVGIAYKNLHRITALARGAA
jgi:CheY-like chemotaxis protein